MVEGKAVREEEERSRDSGDLFDMHYTTLSIYAPKTILMHYVVKCSVVQQREVIETGSRGNWRSDNGRIYHASGEMRKAKKK